MQGSVISLCLLQRDALSAVVETLELDDPVAQELFYSPHASSEAWVDTEWLNDLQYPLDLMEYEAWIGTNRYDIRKTHRHVFKVFRKPEKHLPLTQHVDFRV